MLTLAIVVMSISSIWAQDNSQFKETQAKKFKQFEHHRAFVNGTRIHYRVAGDGEPVLLMHGWLGTSYYWRFVAPVLVDNGYKVIIPDMRGYGDSDKPISGYDGENLVEDMRQLMKQAGITEKIHVVGWDMGALPAYLYAANYPDEVKTLSYLDEPLPSVNIGQLSTFGGMIGTGLWHFGFNATSDLPETLIRGKEKEFIDFFYGIMLYNPESISEEDKQEYLRTYTMPGGIRGSNGWYRDLLLTTEQFKTAIAKGKIKQPVLAYGGQFSLPMTKDQLSLISDNVTGGLIPNCGHMVAEEAPEFLAQELIKFFKANKR